MTAAERLVLMLVADLLIATMDYTRPELVARLKEARHALDAEAYWTRPIQVHGTITGRPVPPILTAEPDPDAA